MSNSERIERGEELIRAYEAFTGVESREDGADLHQVLTDLLTDLHHAVGPQAFEKARGMAEMHYEAEFAEDADETLYNCCTDNKAPDWKQFESLDVGGCTNLLDEVGNATQIISCSDPAATFWTVYARCHDGLAMAITDCTTREDAKTIAAQLSEVSGLPVVAIA